MDDNGGHPTMVAKAVELFGTHETAGDGDNPAILGWARETGLDGAYRHDETPWCGLFMAVTAKRAGKTVVADPLWALNWAAFGTKADAASFGDVLVFKRPGGGHVGLYIAEDASYYYVLGGNESDQVEIEPILKTRLYAARRPHYDVQPANVRPVQRSLGGTVIRDEA